MLRRAQYGGQRALIIDDDRLVRRSLGRQLRSLGLDVVEAATASEARRHLAGDDQLHAVFLDLALGDDDGHLVLIHIRHTRPALPVFVVSGTQIAAEALPTSTTFLAKPVAYETLVDALAKSLSRRSA